MDIIAFLLEIKHLKVILYIICGILIILGGAECFVNYPTPPNIIFGAIGAAAAIAGAICNFVNKKQIFLGFIILGGVIAAMFTAAIIVAVVLEHSFEALIGGIINLCCWIICVGVTYLIWRQTSPDGYEIV